MKKTNYRECYTNEEHAFCLFSDNCEWFLKEKEEFNILPFSESYYRDNHSCFNHGDKLEITLLINILKNEGYIEKTGSPFNIVRLTEIGEQEAIRILEQRKKFPIYKYRD